MLALEIHIQRFFYEAVTMFAQLHSCDSEDFILTLNRRFYEFFDLYDDLIAGGLLSALCP